MRYNLIAIIAFFSALINAQGFKVRHYLPNAQNNTAKAIFESSPGNYVAGGFVVDTIMGNSVNRIAIMGLNSVGQIQWVKKYGGFKFSYLNNPFISRSYYKQGNYLYYTGCVQDSNNKYVGVLIKFNLSGDTLWQKIYQDAAVDIIPQMLTTSVDGGFLITGFYEDWINNVRPCMLIKTDVNGKEIWRKKINKSSPNVSDGKAIVQDSASKKIVIVGYQYLVSNDIHDNILILDSLGNKINQSNFMPIGGVILDMIQSRDKKMVAVGYQYSAQTVGGNNLAKSFAVKFDINNPTLPIWKIDNFDKLALTTAFACLRELNNGDILFSGVIDTLQLLNIPENDLARLTKIDKNGVIKWNRLYDYKTTGPGLTYYQSFGSIEGCMDGGFVAALQVLNNPNPIPNPFFFVKYDSTGCDSSAAYCASLNTVGLQKLRMKSEELRIFPNPVNDVVNIEFQTSKSSEAYDAIVIDIYGREVKTVKIGGNNNKIDVRDLAAGVYFVTISDKTGVIYKTKLIKE